MSGGGGGGDLPRGEVGFLVTGPVLRERQAGQEVIQVLKDLYEAAAPAKASPGGGQAVAGGAAGALEAELGAMRDSKSWVFKLHPVGVRGATFIKMKVPEKDAAWAPRPTQLAQQLMERTRDTGVSRCRFASRVLPVEHSCFCKVEDMRALAAKVLPAAFAEEERVTFSVVYEHRAAAKQDRVEVIDAFAKAVPERHGVDLRSPQRTILVQLVKGTCAVSVVEGFRGLCKYNLKTLVGLDEQGKPLKKPESEGGSGRGKGAEDKEEPEAQAQDPKDAGEKEGGAEGEWDGNDAEAVEGAKETGAKEPEVEGEGSG